ncbi:hypothetical protein MKL11_31050, partial [Methylobacterium sp. J-077]|nr:hypothetical protein [Methylobacterium sp. J-077]
LRPSPRPTSRASLPFEPEGIVDDLSWGSRLDADHPENGVLIPRLITASVRLMGEDGLLTGHVESVAGGIEDRERSAGANLLANVNPTFAWVRLAQRIPVRIKLERVDDQARLVSGRTATVSVDAPGTTSTFRFLEGWRQAEALADRSVR